MGKVCKYFNSSLGCFKGGCCDFLHPEPYNRLSRFEPSIRKERRITEDVSFKCDEKRIDPILECKDAPFGDTSFDVEDWRKRMLSILREDKPKRRKRIFSKTCENDSVCTSRDLSSGQNDSICGSLVSNDFLTEILFLEIMSHTHKWKVKGEFSSVIDIDFWGTPTNLGDSQALLTDWDSVQSLLLEVGRDGLERLKAHINVLVEKFRRQRTVRRHDLSVTIKGDAVSP